MERKHFRGKMRSFVTIQPGLRIYCADRTKTYTIQPGLRIYCADRTKTYSEEASGPSLHDEASAAIGMAGCRYSSAEG